MATLTIKNIPGELDEQLKQSAARSIRALRKNISTVFVAEDDLRAAKDERRS
jgi:hypothetical protein